MVFVDRFYLTIRYQFVYNEACEEDQTEKEKNHDGHEARIDPVAYGPRNIDALAGADVVYGVIPDMLPGHQALHNVCSKVVRQ